MPQRRNVAIGRFINTYVQGDERISNKNIGFKYNNREFRDPRHAVAQQFSDSLVYFDAGNKLIARKFDTYNAFIAHLKDNLLWLPSVLDVKESNQQLETKINKEQIVPLQIEFRLALQNIVSLIPTQGILTGIFTTDPVQTIKTLLTEELKKNGPFQDLINLIKNFSVLKNSTFESILKLTTEVEEKIAKINAVLKNTLSKLSSFFPDFENVIRHPYYQLIELLLIEYNVKYIETRQRMVDFVYTSNNEDLVAAFNLAKRANILNRCLRRDGRTELFDMSIVTYNDQVVEINLESKQGVNSNMSENGLPTIPTIANGIVRHLDVENLNYNYATLIEVMLKHYKKKNFFIDYDAQFEVSGYSNVKLQRKTDDKNSENNNNLLVDRKRALTDNNMLLLKNLKYGTDSATFEIYQNVNWTDKQNGRQLEDKTRKIFTSPLFLRARISIDIFQKNFPKIEKYEPVKHDQRFLSPVPEENTTILSIHAAPSFSIPLSLPVFVPNLKGKYTDIESAFSAGQLQWFYVERQDLRTIDAMTNEFRDFVKLLSDKQRYGGLKNVLSTIYANDKQKPVLNDPNNNSPHFTQYNVVSLPTKQTGLIADTVLRSQDEPGFLEYLQSKLNNSHYFTLGKQLCCNPGTLCVFGVSIFVSLHRQRYAAVPHILLTFLFLFLYML